MKKLKVYSASWCGPCKMVKPTINKLIKEDFDIEVIDLDKNQEEAIANNVNNVPTFIHYDNNVEQGRVSGIPTENDIRGWFE